MVGVERKSSTFDEIPEVACPFESCQKFAVIGRPLLLIRFELRAVKSQRFPSVGAPLLQHASNGLVGSVRRQSK